MKQSKKRAVILITVILGILCVLVIVNLEHWFQSVSVTLKSENVKIIKENGVVTCVKFNGPFGHNKVRFDLKTEVTHDENGNVKQVISTYEGIIIERKLLGTNETEVQIKSSKNIEYVYIFKCSDKQVIIANGILSN